MNDKLLTIHLFARFTDRDMARHTISVKILGKNYADVYDQAMQLVDDLKTNKDWLLEGDIFIRRVEDEE